MSLNVQVLSAEQYDERRRAFMISVEAERLEVYLDTGGNPTIGWGFALNKNRAGNRRCLAAFEYVLRTALRVDPDRDGLSDKAKEREKHWYEALKEVLDRKWKGQSTRKLQEELADVLADRATDLDSAHYSDKDRDLIGTARVIFAYDNTAQILATYERIKAEYEGRVAVFGAYLPTNCDERIAFFSMGYQGTLLSKRGQLTRALWLPNAKDVRAETWFLIRYVRASEPWRGYMESALFKLYDDNNDVRADDARAAYRMFTSHRTHILAYENNNQAQITTADTKLQGSLGIPVLTLEQSLNPAKSALIADLITKYQNAGTPELLSRLGKTDEFRTVDIYVRPPSGTHFLAGDLAWNNLMLGSDGFDWLAGGNENDVLIGEGGHDWLRGWAGSDVLVGGPGCDTLIGDSGNDFLYGGAGNDFYYIFSSDGPGQDRIEDKEGFNTVFVDYVPFRRFKRIEGQTHVYQAVGQQWTGQYVGNDFEITTGTGTRIILNEDFQEGDFGIRFYDELAPGDNPETDNVIQGDQDPEELDDVLTDTAGNDLILGGAGDDWVSAYPGGEDWIIGGDGCDLMDGQSSTICIIEGGADSDVLFGSFVGTSQLFADSFDDEETLIDAGETAEGTGEKGDLIGGGCPGGDNFLYGSNGNDILVAFGGQDLIVGAGGDDLILSDYWESFGVTPDTVHDWSYTIEVDQETYTPVISGVIFGDHLDYEGDYDVIYAGTGNDFIDSGGGDDEVHAGTGDDIVFAEAGDDYVEGGDGDDLLHGDNDISALSIDKHGSDYIDGGNGNDRIWGEGGSDLLLGGDGNDEIAGDHSTDAGYGDDYLDGGAGSDTLWGGSGNDTILGGDGSDYLQRDSGPNGDLPGYGDDYLDGGAGNDTLLGGAGNDELSGGDGDDWIEGNDGDDYMEGGADADTLLGGGGADTMYGGDGADALHGDSADTPLADQGDDYIDGGEGDDTINAYGGNNTIYGGSGNDTIWADAGDNEVYGDDGDDQIYCDAGSDYIEGGVGADIIYADDGDNTVFGGDGAAQIPGDGADLIVCGNGNNTVCGDDGDDQIQCGAGDDYIEGGLGADIIVAGDGTNTVYGDEVDGEAEGNDQIQCGAGDDFIEGGAGDDIIIAGNGSNTVYGDDGNDQIWGGAGSDYLEGGAGDDLIVGYDSEGGTVDNTIYGGDGDDRIYSDAGNDFIGGGAGSDIIFAGEGDNTVFGDDGTDQISAGMGNDYIEGGADNDVIVAGDGTNTVCGDDGDDTLSGEDGDDTYVYNQGDGLDSLTDAGGQDTILMGSGLDFDHTVIRLDATTAHLRFLDAQGNETGQGIDVNLNPDGTIPVETVTFASGAVASSDLVIQSQVTYGTDMKDTIRTGRNDDTIHALEENDVVYAGSSNDNVYAGDGNDFIYGEDGKDTLYGEDANDQLFGQNGDDTLDGGRGDDILRGGTGSDSLSGGDGNDRLYGEVGSDRLFGGSGNDVLYAADGSDELYGEDGDDRLFGSSGSHLLDGGTGNDEILGFEGDETLIGGIGSDTLSGGRGNDILRSGAGDDIIIGGEGDDTIVFNPGDGQDTILYDVCGVISSQYTGGYDYGYDTVKLGADPLDLIFSETQMHTAVSINGTSDSLTMPGGIYSSIDDVDMFEASDGSRLAASQVDQLIQAMATFGAQNGMSWSQAIQQRPSDVQQILAQFWRPQ